jgi:hypothetical protein
MKPTRNNENNTAFLVTLMTSVMCFFIAASVLCPPEPLTSCDIPMLRSADTADLPPVPGRSAELTDPSVPDGEPVAPVCDNKQISRPIFEVPFVDLKRSGYPAGLYKPPKGIIS